MSEAEFLGLLVMGVTTLGGLFFLIHRPLNENTKAMTELTMKIEQLSGEIGRHEVELKSHIKEFEEYKGHVRDSQRRQWEKLDEHDMEIAILKQKGGSERI